MSEQGSAEWLAERCGRVTASRIGDLMAKTKTGWGASRANYLAELVAERLTGKPAERYSNAAMAWGTQTEPDARNAYSFHVNKDVEQIGFVPHPSIAMCGASPDGLVGADGLVEIKCPQTATHIESLRGGAIDKKYMLQMQWQMECTGRQWCDWVSFDPRMPDDMQLLVKRIPRDEAMLAETRAAVCEFLKEIDVTVADLIEKYRRAAA